MLLELCLSLFPQDRPGTPTVGELKSSTVQIGLDFSDAKLTQMLRGVARNLRAFERLRADSIPNSVLPALSFSALAPGISLRIGKVEANELQLPEAARPAKLEDLAYADILTLASLIRSKKVSCLELTELFLARLERVDKKLECVVNYTKDRARAFAKLLDLELAKGKWRGVLHGIPYGAKDLLAARSAPTTWGAKPFDGQVIDMDASVITKLEKAGAVLIAKLSMGALAMGDVWFGGTTKNPWNTNMGSSGSSAGPAAATAAGAVPFSIGTETLGSIISPSARCGCSSLRPTFGRVSRHGAMALTWSMDKLGPICRSAMDASLVFAKIHGADGKDPTAVDLPFTLPVNVKVKGWKIGYFEAAMRGRGGQSYEKVLEELEEMGLELVPLELPDYPVNAMRIILSAEAATAFDELTRTAADDKLVRQGAGAWPNLFRVARLIPAVEYLRANRMRSLLMKDMDRVMAKVDLIVHPNFFGSILLLTNLTGHPTAVVPCGAPRRGRAPGSLSFTGQLFGESRLLAVVQAWQAKTGYHRVHPAEF